MGINKNYKFKTNNLNTGIICSLNKKLFTKKKRSQTNNMSNCQNNLTFAVEVLKRILIIKWNLTQSLYSIKKL